MAAEPGASLCWGTTPDHVPGVEVLVEDAVLSLLEAPVPFSVAVDLVDNSPVAGGPACGDLESDFRKDCTHSCLLDFGPGLDGSYQIFVSGTTGHIRTSS